MNIWTLLITLIIAIVVLAFNPLIKFDPKTPIGNVDKKTRDEVNQVQTEAIQQVNYARQMQQNEQSSINDQ